VVGWIGSFKILNRILRYKWKKETVYKNSLKLISIFLAISLIFNSGAIYEVFHDKPTSMSLSSTMDGPKFNNMEIAGAGWLNDNKLNFYVYSDLYRGLLLNGFFINDRTSLVNNTNVSQPSYIYLGTYNIMYNQIAIAAKGSSPVAYFNGNYSYANKIFDDGGSWVLTY
jgi:uncharacterized membrane protein